MASVLVIDDSPTVVEFIRLALRGQGHEVEALESFVDLPSYLRRTSPAVVFLDLEMPALSGQKTGQLLRQFETHRSSLVIFSSRPRPELEAAAAELEAEAVLEKGAEAERVRILVAELLAARSGAEAAEARTGS